MSFTKKSLQLAVLAARRFATSPRTMKDFPEKLSSDRVHVGFTKIRTKMEKFQVDDGVPVHLKGGVLDKILFQATLLLCAVGLAADFHLFYELSFPKEAEA